MARIGFIGLGNMGLPMAQNLIKAGHQVEGVDVNPAAIERLKAAGGASVETAKIAAARADAVITMLPSGKEVREVYLGSSGIIDNANPGTLLIDCSRWRGPRPTGSLAVGRGSGPPESVPSKTSRSKASNNAIMPAIARPAVLTSAQLTASERRTHFAACSAR